MVYCILLNAALAALVATAAAGGGGKRGNKAGIFGLDCTLLLGPAGEGGGLALRSGPLRRPLSRPEEPAYPSIPWRRLNYSSGAAGFHEETKDLYKYLSPKHEDEGMRTEMMNRIENVTKELCPKRMCRHLEVLRLVYIFYMIF